MVVCITGFVFCFLHRNIFVGAGQMMKIGDLGMAVLIAHGILSGAETDIMDNFKPGTIHYAAPELINKDLMPEDQAETTLFQKVDVWSFGVTIWEILERKRPFEGLTDLEVQSKWLNNPYQARLPPNKIPDSMDVSSLRIMRGLSDLVEACTRLDPSSRPSFGEILRRLKIITKRFSESRETEM